MERIASFKKEVVRVFFFDATVLYKCIFFVPILYIQLYTQGAYIKIFYSVLRFITSNVFGVIIVAVWLGGLHVVEIA